MKLSQSCGNLSKQRFEVVLVDCLILNVGGQVLSIVVVAQAVGECLGRHALVERWEVRGHYFLEKGSLVHDSAG